MYGVSLTENVNYGNLNDVDLKLKELGVKQCKHMKTHPSVLDVTTIISWFFKASSQKLILVQLSTKKDISWGG